jgi:hypothetical protein
VADIKAKEIVSTTLNCKYYEDLALLPDGTVILSGKTALVIHSEATQPITDLGDTVTSITASFNSPHILANVSFAKPSIVLLEH